MKIVTVEQMRNIEKHADATGLSYAQMMRNAGRGVADWVYQHVDMNKGVIGLVGSGNNGGDTLIALRSLANLGIRTMAFLVKERKDDPLVNDYERSGGVAVDISNNQDLHSFQAALMPGVVVLDGILGTGLRLPLRGPLLDVMDNIHEIVQNRPMVRIIAIDCPSGVDCDTGEVSEVTLAAEYTLCMAAIKQGLLQQPGRSHAGDLIWIDIGICDLSKHISADLPVMIDQSYVLETMPPRPETGHKGTFGTCLVIAGTTPYTGAAFLTGKAAYRSGCGLVNVATLRKVHGSLSGRLIEAVWTILPDIDDAYDPQGIGFLSKALTDADSLVVGPGWGLHDETGIFLDELLQTIPGDLPTLFDADGLKLLNRIDNWWEILPKKTILTPHPGEMAILTGLSISEIQSNRWKVAQEYAKRWGLCLLLKGAVTVIGTPEGGLFVNPANESALATAGSGDVLSGAIGGLLAQGLSATSASTVGVWLHSKAGRIARESMGTGVSVTALNILDYVGQAFV